MATIPELFDSLKTYIRSVIQDKIDLAEQASAEAVAARNLSQSWRDSSKAYSESAATSASNAASAATTAVTTAVNKLKGGAPEAFDTLGEIADELAANQTLHAAMLNQIADATTKAQWENVTGKPSTFPTSVAEVSGLPAIDKTPEGNTIAQRAGTGTLDVAEPISSVHAANKGYVDSQITTRAASSHTHSISNVTGLQAALDSKQPKSWTGTQAQFDALATKDPAVTYNIVAG